MVRINSVLSSLLNEQSSRPNFVLKGEKLPFIYQPFVALLGDERATERYLIGCEGASQEAIKNEFNTSDLLSTAATAILLGPLGALAFWTYKEMSAAEAKAKDQKRMDEFRAMLGLALELRSCRTLLTLASPRPETLKQIELPKSVLLEAPTKAD
jgi:hypothetical protein